MSSVIENDQGHRDEGYHAFLAELSCPPRVARSQNYIFMTGGSDMRGIALDDYTKACPPGWQPYMHNYPLKV